MLLRFIFVCFAGALLLGGALAAHAEIRFNDVSTFAGIDHRGESYGASWGDLNGDAYPDLFVSNHRTQNSLFLNRGDGRFLDVAKQTHAWIWHPNADTHGGTWADFDNDGDQDLLVTTGTGNPMQFLVNERGALIDRTEASGLTAFNNLGGRLPIWLDYNNDRLLDVVITQMGGSAKVMKQTSSGFIDDTSTVRMVCNRFHYGQLIDVNGDARVDFLCPSESSTPQKVYDTLPTPWANITSTVKKVDSVIDTVIADFNNDGRPDTFALSNVQLRPSSVALHASNKIEAMLMGGEKGFNFVSSGVVTVNIDWTRIAAGYGLPRIYIGGSGMHPKAVPFTLDPADPNVAGMPADSGETPVIRIGYDPATQRWTVIMRAVTDENEAVWSNAYFELTSTNLMSDLKSTGFWLSDHAARPTLIMNTPGGFVDMTESAGLAEPIQCASATAGDFDNDMDIDIYIVCRNGVRNLPNMLFENQGSATFIRRTAFGAVGPVGIAVVDGVGTSDSVVTADYDGDGFLDLFVTNGFNMYPREIGGANKLFKNAGNANHWIELDLVGTLSARDAVGATVTATANGVNQYRVKNDGYHRWSQEHTPLHFGLGSASSVNLTVRWPNGTQEVFQNVAADRLYRITQNVGIVAVTPGAALPYPCSYANFDAALERGIYISKNCTDGTWLIRASSGGSAQTISYQGEIVSSTAFQTVAARNVESSWDTLDTSEPERIGFIFNVNGSSWDGVDFLAAQGASTCFTLSAPANTPVYFGPLKVPVPMTFDLETLGACGEAPPVLNVADIMVNENQAAAEFVLQLSKASDQTVSVNAATVDYTAEAGADYQAQSGMVSFAPGETSAIFQVPLFDDGLIEGDEAFMIVLSNAVNADLARSGAAATVIDDENSQVCGAPAYNAGLTAGTFVWRDCASGQWSLRVTAGGQSLKFAGRLYSAQALTSVEPFSFEGNDVLDRSDPQQAVFGLFVYNTGEDGLDFRFPAGNTICLQIDTPTAMSVYVGSDLQSVTPPFDLETLQPCSL